MSTATPTGLTYPRWSVTGAPVLVPLSMAGLPASSACVQVYPPLFARDPRSGFVLIRSPGPVNPQLLVDSRLYPWEVTVFEQSPPVVLFATMVFFTLTVPPWRRIPPPAALAVLAVMVTLSSVAVPSLWRPPPLRTAELALSVELVRASVAPLPRLTMAPPSSAPAELEVKVELVTVELPESL